MRISSRSLFSYILVTNLFTKNVHCTSRAFHLDPSFSIRNSGQLGHSILKNQRFPIHTSGRRMSTMDSASTIVPGRVALLQFVVTDSKELNLKKASEFIAKAAEGGAQLLVLPEIWNSPYATTAFGSYAEKVPDVGEHSSSDVESPSISLLIEKAKQYSIYIIGGSIPEVCEDGNIYNTCICVDTSGTIVAKHRKVHLFDIDVPGGIRFKESDTLSPGHQFTFFNAGESFGNIGVGIW